MSQECLYFRLPIMEERKGSTPEHTLECFYCLYHNSPPIGTISMSDQIIILVLKYLPLLLPFPFSLLLSLPHGMPFFAGLGYEHSSDMNQTVEI